MKRAAARRRCAGPERLLDRGAREHRLPDRGLAAHRPQAAAPRVPHHRHPALRLPLEGRRPPRALRGAAAGAARAGRRRACCVPESPALGGFGYDDRRAAVQRGHAEVLRGADRHGAGRRAAAAARDRSAGRLRDRRRAGAASPTSSRRWFRGPPTSSWTFPSCSCSRRPTWRRCFPTRASAVCRDGRRQPLDGWRDADFVFVPTHARPSGLERCRWI